uniref:Uncharacterized protein n=1 Tax=Ditylenchus dipsaci TaxID=166011 RepID=A0A915D0V8_9BILA
MDSQSNGESDKNSRLEGIPMPAADEKMEVDEKVNDSWRRAQRALGSIGQQPKAAASQPQPYPAGPFGMPSPYHFAAGPGYMPPPYYNTALAAGYAPQMFMPYAYPSSTSQPTIPPQPQRPRQFLPRPQPAYSAQATKHLKANAPNIKPIRFIISSNSQVNKNIASSVAAAGSAYPPAAKDYIERAYAAVESAQDKEKLENYLKQRIDPLLQSGAIHAVNWANEPLPHTVNYVVRTLWTPASSMKKQQQGSPSKSSSSSSVIALSPERVVVDQVAGIISLAMMEQSREG